MTTAADQTSSSRSDPLIRRLWEMSEASGQHTEDRAVWAAAAAHIGGLRTRLADQDEQVKEALEKAASLPTWNRPMVEAKLAALHALALLGSSALSAGEETP